MGNRQRAHVAVVVAAALGCQTHQLKALPKIPYPFGIAPKGNILESANNSVSPYQKGRFSTRCARGRGVGSLFSHLGGLGRTE